MDWRLERTQMPSDAVTVQEVKQQLRVDSTAEDQLIGRYISAAQEYLEGPYGIGVLLGTQKWTAYFDRFYGIIRLPLYPVQSIDEITYVDQDGATQVLDSGEYRVDLIGNPARITTEYNVTWPVTRAREPNAVAIKFTGGWSSIPEDLRQAVVLLASHMYEMRQPVVTGTTTIQVPLGLEAILGKYRVVGIG